MANITASVSVQSAIASTSPDSIQLHTFALNNLSRCKALLLADEPMYEFARKALDEVQRALVVLQVLEAMNAKSAH